MTNHYPNEQDALANLRCKYEALQEENIKLKADLREARMQSLADLGQAQDALEAQKKTEAERDQFVVLSDALQEVVNQMRAIVETE